jgi:predicted nucleotidyltransferase
MESGVDNKEILSAMRDLLLEVFPGIVSKVLLFGSRATDSWNEDSDFDVLIIIKEKADWRLQNEIINACYSIDLKYDVVTDVKIIAESELETSKGRQPYILKAISSGMVA